MAFSSSRKCPNEKPGLRNSLLNGGVILIDLGGFDMKIDVVADKFNDLEKGLFAKLLDRSVLHLGRLRLFARHVAKECFHTHIYIYICIYIYSFCIYI